MKKIAILSLLAFFLLPPFELTAQKKNTKATKTNIPVKIVTNSDSISYAFGASIVESLPQYLFQMGVLADTAAIKIEFSNKIANETDPKEKANMEAKLKFSIDSANKANDAAIIKFLEGFESAFNKTNGDDKAYNMGISIANQTGDMINNFSKEVLGDEASLNRNLFAQAFTGSLKKEKLLIDNPQDIIQQKAQEAQAAKQKMEQDKLKGDYAEQIAAGEKFMRENKNKPGVVTLPSGLQYKIVTEGNGPKPNMHDKVKVHYHGTLLDGTVFDSSVERGEPLDLTIGQLIAGWNEALTMMPTGSKWILYVPYDLAYGERNMGVIKPFSDLIFEVELIDIVQPAGQ